MILSVILLIVCHTIPMMLVLSILVLDQLWIP